ncbi:MAG: hypothetical protein HZC42_10280 [Candidatus Eisenbacteria bacterium]|nr:hypothetical protein [Candidatus Eisenbacteria bacterium]
MWLRLPLGGATLTMASCCNFAALLVLPRGHAMAATALAAAVAELIVMRKPPRRVLFNAGQSALAVGAAASVFGALRGPGPPPLEVTPWAAFVAAAAAFALVNYGAVSVAVALSERVSPLTAWRRNFGNAYDLLSSGALFSLGILLAVHYTMAGARMTALAVLPLVLGWVSYRRFLAEPPQVEARPPAPRLELLRFPAATGAGPASAPPASGRSRRVLDLARRGTRGWT